MKLFLIVSLLGTALASPGGVAYSSYSTAYGPLARAALAYGGYSGAPLTALHGEGFLATGAAYSAAPVAGYAASAPVAGYAAAAPVASYAAAAPVAGYAAAAPVAGYAAAAPVAGYAAAAPLAGYAAAAPVAGYAAAVPVTGYAAAAPLTSYSAATHVVASAPAVAAAPVATYAAAPVAAVAHAPAAAVVPVTRVSAQPAVVQNVVDVAQAKLATRRFEIRRPAIQKEFYDVEERVVVRPAGSAVVELETPIGANQRGPTKISPAAPPVALHSYTSTHLGASVGPTVLPHAPIAVTPVPHFPDVVEPSHEIQQISQQPEPVQQFQPQIPQQSIPQPSFPSQDVSQQQFDDSDSVSIDNPEISVRTSAPPQPTRQSLLSPLYRSQVPQFPRAEAPLPQFSEGPLPEQQRSEGLPSFSRSRVTQYLEPEQLPPQTRNQTPLPRVQPTARPETTESRQQEPDFSFIRNQLPAFNQGPVISQRQGPNTQTQSQVEFESQSFGSEPVIPSLRNLSPEQSRANQARLLDLLTARGPVSEVRSASEPIRGRVISATPAPSGAEPTDEKVNTRRIVVNRPIQTVQEFDVVEPFTKLERVAVNHPAVVKTAHVELAAFPAVHAVHTAVPAAVTPAPYYIK